MEDRRKEEDRAGSRGPSSVAEDHLDSYFVDRLRFLSEKDRRAQRLLQRFKESEEQEAALGNHESLAVVCVDGSPEADAAFDFALRHLPLARSLVLAHGIHVSLTTSDTPFGEDDDKHLAMERRYMEKCRDAKRHCMVKHFTYNTKGGLGHAICSLADKKDAASVVIGQRHPRPLLGASSTAVMRYCGRRPVILVPRSRRDEPKEEDVL